MEKRKIGTSEDLKEDLLESNLFYRVEEFFSTKKSCDEVGSVKISLLIFGSIIYPDVYGLQNPTSDNSIIYMAEGKKSFKGRNFDICKGQGITLQRFADFVYLFFPIESWNSLNSDEQNEITNECKNMKLGLLLVDNEGCQELISPQTNSELLDETKKTEAKDEITNFFPNYIESDKNIEYFLKYTRLSNTILSDSVSLIYEVYRPFINLSPQNKASLQIYITPKFQFSYSARFRSGFLVYLTLYPLGHLSDDENLPILVIEEKYYSSMISNKDDFLLTIHRVKEALKNGLVVDFGDEIFKNDDVSLIDKYLLNDKPDEVFVYHKIPIMGVKKEDIINVMTKVMEEIVSYHRGK